MNAVLTFLIFLLIVGGVIVAVLPGKNDLTSKLAAIMFSGLALVFSVAMLLPGFDAGHIGFQHQEQAALFSSLGISYHLGIDGISLWLILLTTFLSFVAVAFSWNEARQSRYFLALILILEGAMIGAFASLDLVLFFTFFEMTLVPMWLLIAFWGGEKRSYAANKFLIYTFAGSIFLLLGMIALAIHGQTATGKLSFDIVDIQRAVGDGRMWTGALQFETVIFWGFAAAFLVKSPIFPFHTWAPDMYGESPTAGPILSGAMVKLGSYGFLRFCLPLFPDAAKSQIAILATLATIGIVYAAVVATVQTDVRRLLGYSSVSHMGFVMLGIFSLNQTGMVGGAYQQINHGVISCLLFLLVGFLIQRRGTANFRDYGGLKAQMPVFAAIFLVATLAGLGLPGTNGFVGEFLSLLGIYRSGYENLYGLSIGLAVAAAGSMILTAGYMLYTFQQLFYGECLDPANRQLKDLKPWEVALSGSLVLLIVAGGFYSPYITKSMEPSIVATQQMVLQPAASRPLWASGSVADHSVQDRSSRALYTLNVSSANTSRPKATDGTPK